MPVLLASLTLGAQPWIKRWTGTAERTRDSQAVLLPTIFVAAVYGGYFGGALGVVLIAVLSFGIGFIAEFGRFGTRE